MSAGSHLLLRAFCDELARCGMRTACTAPGSRNTPITLALVREPQIACHSHIDERCAGFFALGAAKAAGLPVAITATSGTAVANLAPAVIEAHHARVPLIVLSADRPPELREVGAGQTIDQLKIFGGAVRWFFEVGVDEATPEHVRWARTLACRAYWTALGAGGAGRAGPGPVHLNFPLREPLVPAELPADPAPGRSDGRPWVTFERRSTPATQTRLPAGGRTVIVAGAGAPAGLPEAAARAGVPLLADPLSAARRGPGSIAHYDLLLRDPEFVATHQPERIVRVGELPTSKPLRAWLASLPEVDQLAVDPDGYWQDPAGVVGRRIEALPPCEGEAPAGWLDSWQRADAVIGAAVEQTLGEELSEPVVAGRLAEWLPDEATLLVASSMPIRDMEEFMAARDGGPAILSNRGANGIDGTVSAAFGAAAVSDGPVVLLIGDVALAHDIGGLLAARRLGLAVTIVLLNNDGGGIFHFLPVSEQADAFTEHVATPHGLEFTRVAELYELAHELPGDVGQLRAALGRGLQSSRSTIIEIRTDRKDNLALHRRVADAAIRALATIGQT